MSADDEYHDYLDWEKRRNTPHFHRTSVRVRRLKVKLDCGHWIDGSEIYRYQVWKYPGDETISQRTDCDVCSREDNRY